MMKYTDVASLVNEILAQYDSATIRQIYYRMVSPPYQYMDNTRSMYCSFDAMLTRAREEGLVDWRKIADHTRNNITPDEYYYDDAMDYLETKREGLRWWSFNYNVDYWENQPYCVRVFIEKDALAQVVSSVALEYKITTIPGRGYNSVTQLMALADEFRQIDKSIIVLYFGDFDPTGLDIDRSASERLSAYSETDIKLVRMALTESDIQGLPPNPTKASDPRAEGYVQKYGNRCWELDALPPNELQNRVRASIKAYIDEVQWQKDREREKADRDYVDEVAEKIGTLWNNQDSEDDQE